jgi:hypothetical protein
VAGTGLAETPKEYRRRLNEQSDAQIDAWASELMRDVAKEHGPIKVLEDLRKSTKLTDSEIERAFALGDGPPAIAGRDRKGRLMIPAVALYAVVPGIRVTKEDGRNRLIDYLVANFGEVVYV